MFKLAIANTVKVPVKFNLNNGGKVTPFSFSMLADRMSQEEITATAEDKDVLIRDILRKVVTGWTGQTLVLDADDKPAEFSDDAFNVMLGVVGVPQAIYHSYIAEIAAKTKN